MAIGEVGAAVHGWQAEEGFRHWMAAEDMDGQAMLQGEAIETGTGCDWPRFAGAAW
jgi:hypothetical protein